MNPSRKPLALLSFLPLLVLAGLTAGGATGAPSPGKATISPEAVVKDRQVLVGGYSPTCAEGRTFAIEAEVRRAGRAARGRTRGLCTGSRVSWEGRLKSPKGRLGTGIARARIVTTVRRDGKLISTRRSSRKIKLVEYAPIRGGWSYGNIMFDMDRAGAQVKITGGGAGTSNCTRDETVTSFTTNSNPEKHEVAIYAKSDGSCWNERSWSSFKIEVRGADGRTGSGRVTQGDFEGSPPLYGYGLDCRADWYAAHKEMNGLKCERTGRYDVTISWP
ncbi:MAG TPA: hypothetical protein VMF31_12725 [Solirubrobacterales bacterium]|nr:hypothetical protein [Solirubrobacterales bacterium]